MVDDVDRVPTLSRVLLIENRTVVGAYALNRP